MTLRVWTFLIILIIILVALVISWAIGRAATKKNRGFWGFFLISFLLFPIGAVIMGIIVASLAPPEAAPLPHPCNLPHHPTS